MADNKPKFIRRNGRVIPIRAKDANKSLVKRPGAPPPPPKKKERKSLFKAAGSIALGGVASLYGGSWLNEFSSEAARSKEAAKGLFKRGLGIKRQAAAMEAGTTSIPKKDIEFLKKQAKTFTFAGARARARGTRLGKQGRFVGGVALGVGSVLVGYGLSQAAEELFGRKTSAQEEIITTVAGGIATSVAAHELGLKQGISNKAARKVIQALLKRGL